jgi:ubiquitin-protein ligase
VRRAAWINEERALTDAMRADCKRDAGSGIRVALVDESPFHLIGTFPGPDGSPYAGGTFDVVRVYAYIRVDCTLTARRTS